MGFTQDFLFRKKLRPCRKGASSLNHIRLEANSQIADITWSIRERFNLQLELGSGQFQWNWHQSGTKVHGRSNYGFLWSGDAKLVILEVKRTSFAIDGQAGSSSGLGVRYNYWQGGAALTQKIGAFAPYLGWSFNQTNFKVASAYFHSKIFSGPFAGCSLSNGSRGFLNVEWRGWFEQGLALMGQLRF